LEAVVPGAPVKLTPREFEAKIAEVRREYRAAERAVTGAPSALERAKRLGNQAMLELVQKTIEESRRDMERLEETEMDLALKFGLRNWETLGARNRRERGQVRDVMVVAKQVSARQLAAEAAEAAELNELKKRLNTLRG
jgi:hypothetical protein